jgi:hypothetical protein
MTDRNSTIMPCGHTRKSVVSSSEGTNYCEECEEEARDTTENLECAVCGEAHGTGEHNSVVEQYPINGTKKEQVAYIAGVDEATIDHLGGIHDDHKPPRTDLAPKTETELAEKLDQHIDKYRNVYDALAKSECLENHTQCKKAFTELQAKIENQREALTKQQIAHNNLRIATLPMNEKHRKWWYVALRNERKRSWAIAVNLQELREQVAKKCEYTEMLEDLIEQNSSANHIARNRMAEPGELL